eukprot:TRINITY_DN56294_c0_g1_i1.p1 TRINITY_DN56294_c0_g1~~TRINITY_DN56294_c0_g1_i1.p1  ORF type:complete len:520 (+),score=129.95 TRINITY_DN56294_c0_g1_i1:116-1675(+)
MASDVVDASAAGKAAPAVGDVFPLSFSQEQMLRIQVSNPGTAAYNVNACVWIAGGLCPKRLRAAVQTALGRHKVFQSVAVISPPGLRITGTLPHVAIVDVEDEAAALVRMGQLGRIPFRLEEEPSVRVELAVVPSGLILLIMWAHHMNFDMYSQKHFYQDVYLILTGREAALPVLHMQYMDFARWQRASLASGEIDPTPMVEDMLRLVKHALDLPLDKERPKRWTFNGDSVSVRLPGDLEFREGVSPFVAHLTAFFIALWKSTGQEMVALGVPFHGRTKEAAAPAPPARPLFGRRHTAMELPHVDENKLHEQASLDHLYGYFINMLVVVGEAKADMTVAEALAATKHGFATARQRARIPYLQVIDDLVKSHGARFDPSRNPLFQAMLNYRVKIGSLAPDPRFRLQAAHNVEGHMDVDVQVDWAADGTIVTFNYCVDLFHARTVERLAARYVAALHCCAKADWADVEIWRLPDEPELVDAITAAAATTPELVAQQLLPQLAALSKSATGTFLGEQYPQPA